MRDRDHGLYQYATCALLLDVEEIDAKLKGGGISSDKKVSLSRQLWVRKGVIEHGLDMGVLEHAEQHYIEPGVIPSGYDLISMSKLSKVNKD